MKKKKSEITAQEIRRIHKRQCPQCGVPMDNGIDSITGEISKYLWEFKCECWSKNIVLSIG